jgi:hypothetical protein
MSISFHSKSAGYSSTVFAAMIEKQTPANVIGQTLTPTSTVELSTEAPPGGGYGLVQVGVAFVINAFTWGQTAVSHPSGLFSCQRLTPL